MTNVTLLYFDGCPNWQVADERLRRLQDEADFTLDYATVDTPHQAQRLGFRGSPTLLIEGKDPFATGAELSGLACRFYDTPDGLQGSPTLAQLRAALA